MDICIHIVSIDQSRAKELDLYKSSPARKHAKLQVPGHADTFIFVHTRCPAGLKSRNCNMDLSFIDIVIKLTSYIKRSR